jgi:hypothetical protein
MAKIVLIGDSLFNEEIFFDEKITGVCKSADIVIINIEGPIISSSIKPEKPYGFCSNESAIANLKKLKVTAAILANNHIMDYGVNGLNETILALQKAGINMAGAGTDTDNVFQNIAFEINKKKIMLMAYSHREFPLIGKNMPGPVPLPDISWLKNNICEYKKSGYFIIFCYHGGEEYFSVPWPRRRSFFLFLNKLGVDIVFGNHSHSVQPVEIMREAPIIYSPGNFYFDAPGERQIDGTDEGLIAEIEFNDNKTITLHHVKANRDNHRVDIVNSDKFSLTGDITLDFEKYSKIWVEECKKYFMHSLRTNPANNKFFYKNARRIKRIKTEIFNLLKAPDASRGIDILLSAMPFIGIKYAGWLGRNGYKYYKF